MYSTTGLKSVQITNPNNNSGQVVALVVASNINNGDTVKASLKVLNTSTSNTSFRLSKSIGGQYTQIVSTDIPTSNDFQSVSLTTQVNEEIDGVVFIIKLGIGSVIVDDLQLNVL